ncbi:hypothetical protein OG205_24525 [Lentzea sp. NBC_00516]|uniref:hypothetical protein n=1 Tax=Lentzea sp. NBC_00516 TaxID=2903582 RepID=UPI002E800F41|nr:hypothetical protein [Lentzea sp. NBC_00516]WUD21306.1 hypothetical protein OG205_24525 [Lentzea sp. NBC_00516]
MGDASRHVSLDELKTAFECEQKTNPRAAAETAYALAILYRNYDVKGCRRFDLAKLWANRAIAILAELPSGSIEDVVSTRDAVGGVALPELLHAESARLRLADVVFE